MHRLLVRPSTCDGRRCVERATNSGCRLLRRSATCEGRTAALLYPLPRRTGARGLLRGSPFSIFVWQTARSSMTALVIVLGVMLGLVVLVGLLVVGLYNSLVSLRNRYKNAFSQIDVQLKRRYDLIPNLVETAKGYLQHERETLEAVIRARNVAVS